MFGVPTYVGEDGKRHVVARQLASKGAWSDPLFFVIPLCGEKNAHVGGIDFFPLKNATYSNEPCSACRTQYEYLTRGTT